MGTSNYNIDQLAHKIAETLISKLKKLQKSQEIRIFFDFDNIPDEDLDWNYRDLTKKEFGGGFGDRFMLFEGTLIQSEKEPKTTLSPDETRQTIKFQFGLEDWQIKEKIGKNEITIMVLYPEIFRNSELIIDGMKACGWSIGYRTQLKRGPMIWNVLEFEPIFQEMISDTERDKHRFLYHWTPYYNLPSIMKYGLVPKSENAIFSYPNRIHFFTEIENTSRAMAIGKQLFLTNSSPRNNGKYVALAIDLTKAPYFPLYKDPRYETGLYGKDTVPPSSIKPVFGFDFENNKEFNVNHPW